MCSSQALRCANCRKLGNKPEFDNFSASLGAKGSKRSMSETLETFLACDIYVNHEKHTYTHNSNQSLKVQRTNMDTSLKDGRKKSHSGFPEQIQQLSGRGKRKNFEIQVVSSKLQERKGCNQIEIERKTISIASSHLCLKVDGFVQKHRKNCECCPGHHLIVDHYSSI